MIEDDFPAFSVGTPQVASDSVALAQALRRFLDGAAALRPDHQLVMSLIADLDRWSDRLENDVVAEDESLWRRARRDQPPALLPALSFAEDGERLTGKVTFGRFHIGRGAAHGGAIGMVFDEVMGALASSRGRLAARTANLAVDYRALTPIDRELSIHASFERMDGRKRYLKASLNDGGLVCAEARGLWVELKRS